MLPLPLSPVSFGVPLEGPELPETIRALACFRDFTFAAHGCDVAVFSRAHQVRTRAPQAYPPHGRRSSLSPCCEADLPRALRCPFLTSGLKP